MSISGSFNPTVDAVAITDPPGVSLALTVGDTFQAAAQAFAGSSLVNQAITWTTSDPTKATVSLSGFVTAIAAGSPVIRATCNGFYDEFTAVIVAAPATVFSVTVTPTPTAVTTTGSTIFTATVKDSGGNLLLGRVVSWQSLNTGIATVGADSGTDPHIMTAPAVAAGTVTIRATCAGVTGDAVLTVQATSTLHVNEPAGMTVFSDRRFDAKVEGGWADRGDANFSIISDATAPVSPSNVGQARYPIGFPSGQGPIQTALVYSSTNLRTIYACYWIKISGNWLGNASGGSKVIFFHTSGATGTARVYSALRGAPAGDMSVEMDFQNMGTRDDADPDTKKHISWNGHSNQNFASSILPRDVWKKWAIVLVMNTPGQYDGEAHWWLDGVKVGQYTAIGIAGPSESALVWRKVDWNPTYGGAGPNLDRTQYMWIDHLYVSGKA